MRLLSINSASSKFYNYHTGDSMRNADVVEGDPVTHVVATTKVSGSMCNIGTHPVEPNSFIITTKNGCQARFCMPYIAY